MAALQSALNVVMRAVLATPLLHRAVSNRVLVVDVIGRKTGRRYRIPVGFTSTTDGLLVGTVGRWRRNLMPGQHVCVTVRRQRREMLAEVITDEARCAELYGAILSHNPVHGRYAHVHLNPDGTANRSELRSALDHGLAVVRLADA
jgi:hypothetical protein